MNNDKNKVYDYITQKVLKNLENGVVPWRKTWHGVRPHNYVSRKPYRGINPFLLEGTEFLSFKQIVALKGHVKKGAKAQMVVFWKFIDQKKKNEKGEWVVVKDAKGKNKTVPLLRYYNVFSLADVEGIPSRLTDEDKNPALQKPEEIINGYKDGPKISHGDSNNAFYRPSDDLVNVPPKKVFEGSEEYYSTFFHELVHSTGHEKRLNRKLSGFIFDNHAYSEEELVAEFGATFLNTLCGYEQKVIGNASAYIKHWADVIKADNTLIVHSAGKAQRAVDRILGLDRKEEEKKTEDEGEDE